MSWREIATAVGLSSTVIERWAAIFYSPIESAKLAGVEPSAYIREATRRAIEAPGTVTLPADLPE